MKSKHSMRDVWGVIARLGVGLALVIVALGSLPAPVARAATYNVSNTNDSGGGSLRQAITDANNNPGPDTITFSTSGTITLGSSLPSISGNLTIIGPGAAQLTISGAGSFQPFDIASGVTVAISDLTIANGSYSGDGGAIFNEGTLTVNRCTIRDSQAQNGGGISNWSGATLNVYNSTISGNTADWGGGIVNYSTMTLSHATVTSNTSTTSYGAGGIGQWNSSGSPTGTIVHSTIVLNSATDSTESGLFVESGTVNVSNSIVSHNGSGGSTTNNFKTDGGSIASQGYNVSNSAIPNPAAGDLQNTDPRIYTLADNGGGTLTHGLQAVSGAAVDLIPSGTNGCGTTHTTDQRGQPRPVDRSGVSGTGCDAGAFELQNSETPNAVTLLGLAARTPLPTAALAVGLLGALGGATFLGLHRRRRNL
jgi:hypothetical protein